MLTLRLFVFFTFTTSLLFAGDVPSSAVVSNSLERAFDVTRAVRTNGCKLELWRYAKSKPYLQGYWIQHVYVGDKHILRIEHSVTEKEQTLLIDQDTGYGVLQIDRNLGGKYEMLIVASLKDKRMIDVLLVTDDGWLRHSTPEEFQSRQRIADGNRRAMEELEKSIREAGKKAVVDSKK